MREYLKFYIDGRWVEPVLPNALAVENPTTEERVGAISLGSAADVERAVKAARTAFAGWSQTTREDRLDLLQAVAAEYAIAEIAISQARSRSSAADLQPRRG